MKIRRYSAKMWHHSIALSTIAAITSLVSLLAVPSLHAATYTWTTLAGGNGSGFANGMGSSATFTAPRGVAVDENGNVYVAQTLRIRKITPSGEVSTFPTAGLGSTFSPWGIAVGADGFIYATDWGNHYLFKFSPSGAMVRSMLVEFSGRGLVADADGRSYVVSAAAPGVFPMIKSVSADGSIIDNFAGRFNEFFSLDGLARDFAGNLYTAGNVISLVTPAGVISTAVSQGGTGIAVDAAGNNIFVTQGHTIRHGNRQADNTFLMNTIGGSVAGKADGIGAAALFNSPSGIAVDGNGDVYVADLQNNRIVKGTTGANPELSVISPVSAFAGQVANVQLIVRGSRFVNGADVLWNGTPLSTTFVSESQLNATVPAANLIGNPGHTISYPISVRNPNGNVSLAHIFIVNGATVVAHNQILSTYANAPLLMILSGDSPASPGAPLTYSVSVQPAHGSLSGTPPALTYAPNSGFTGGDAFQFTVSDGSTVSASATVSITVAPVGQELYAETAVPPGEAQTVSVPPGEGQAGATATFSKNSSGAAALISVQTYATNPTDEEIGGEGTQFVDIRVLGANTGDSLTAQLKLHPSIAGGPVSEPGPSQYPVVWYDPPPVDDNGNVAGRANPWGWKRVIGRATPSSPPAPVTVPAGGGDVVVTFDETTSPKLSGAIAGRNEFGGTVFAIATPASPTPGANHWETALDKTIAVPIVKLLAGAFSSTAGPLSVIAVNPASTEGGSVSLSAEMITYTPPAGFVGSDSFTYVLSDDYESAQATVQLNVRSSSEQSRNQVALKMNGPCATVDFLGIPGLEYVVQTASAVSGPWTDILPAISANSTGLISFTDCDSAAERYYRTRLSE